MIVDCPHCFRRVITNDDGSCPSCGNDPSKAGNSDPNLRPARIASEEELPDVCIGCGVPTPLRRKFVRRRTSPHASEAGESVGGVGGFLLAMVFRFLLQDNKQTVSIKLPVCQSCSTKEPTVLHIDFDNYEADFVVHRLFWDALRQKRKDRET